MSSTMSGQAFILLIPPYVKAGSGGQNAKDLRINQPDSRLYQQILCMREQRPNEEL
jgi:hypothetical protein